MKVVAFNGSPRIDGNTFRLLSVVLQELKNQGIQTELVQLANAGVHGCRACHQCFNTKNQRCAIDNDPVNECIGKMVGADGVIMGSPTYFSGITPELKAFMDRAFFVARANGNLFRRKVGAAIVAVRRGGAIPVFDTINHFFLISEMIIPGSTYWNMAVGREKGAVEKDEEGMATMKALGQNMAWLLSRLHGGNPQG